MSDAEQSALPARVRETVTPPYFGRPDAEMTALGLALFAGLVIVLVPLLPFLVVVWLVMKLLDRFAPGDRTGGSSRRSTQ